MPGPTTDSAPRTIRLTSVVAVTVGVLGLSLAVPPSTAQMSPALGASVHDPVDPADWVEAGMTTWADYRPVPDSPTGWADGSATGSVREFKVAVVLVDFTDQQLLLTQPAGSHLFGNPQAGWQPIQPSEAAQWWEDYLGTPNADNHGHTVTEYWMETSNGRYSVDVDAFGPYTLPGKLHEYGFNIFAPVTGENSVCPAGDDCTKNLRTDGLAAWTGERGPDIRDEYDHIFVVAAGHDESSTWQQFGEMRFLTKEDVPAEFGPPGATEGPVLNAAGNPIPNWAPTRYVEWTSWKAAANVWPVTGSGITVVSESVGQGAIAHELVHLLGGITDNYNLPSEDRRTHSGLWDMLGWGTYNGPGGVHTRWHVPSTAGGSMASHLTLPTKLRLSLVDAGQAVQLSTDQLAEEGLARATLSARSVNRVDRLAGFTVALSAGDQSSCATDGLVGDRAWLCDGGNYSAYTVEVVDRMGMDSFVPSSGVHLAKTKPIGTRPVWTIDASPEDIDWVDFIRPDGTPAMVSVGDPRQLNDALFRAGTGSGSSYEHVDEANGLHFYVLERKVDDTGVLTYDVAVRSLEGSGPQARGVSLGHAVLEVAEDGATLSLAVLVTNTGAAGAGLHDSDVYRVSATLQGAGWALTQPYEVVAASAGETIQVPLHLGRAGGGAATLAVTVSSESDPEVSQTLTIRVQDLLLERATSTLRELVAARALPNGVAQKMTAWMNQVVDSIEKGKVKQADMALDRIQEALPQVLDPDAQQTLQDLVVILRQS